MTLFVLSLSWGDCGIIIGYAIVSGNKKDKYKLYKSKLNKRTTSSSISFKKDIENKHRNHTHAFRMDTFLDKVLHDVKKVKTKFDKTVDKLQARNKEGLQQIVE